MQDNSHKPFVDGYHKCNLTLHFKNLASYNGSQAEITRPHRYFLQTATTSQAESALLAAAAAALLSALQPPTAVQAAAAAAVPVQHALWQWALALSQLRLLQHLV